MDKLDEIFDTQGELMGRFGHIEQENGAIVPHHTLHGQIDNRHVQIRLKALAYCAIEELCEAMNMLRNRPWKVTQHEMSGSEIIGFNEELADAFHFFVELCIVAGLDATELYEFYTGKAKDNITRIEEGV